VGAEGGAASDRAGAGAAGAEAALDAAVRYLEQAHVVPRASLPGHAPLRRARRPRTARSTRCAHEEHAVRAGALGRTRAAWAWPPLLPQPRGAGRAGSRLALRTLVFRAFEGLGLALLNTYR
jgi:hypothetical protein